MQNKDKYEIGGFSVSLRSYRILLAGILAAVCIAAGIAIFMTAPKSFEADTVQASNFAYYLKEVDGKIGAFHTGESVPFYTLTVPPEVLPETDRAELKEGVYVEDEARLRQIIEDFEG